MKTTKETIEFPCEIKKKIKMKVSMGNLEVYYKASNRPLAKLNI